MTAPAAVGTVDNLGNCLQFIGVAGTADQSDVLTTGDVSRLDEFFLMSTAGAFSVFGCLDDTNFAATPLSLEDLGAAAATIVTASTAGHIYRLRAKFRYLKVLQEGATDVANFCMLAAAYGRPY